MNLANFAKAITPQKKIDVKMYWIIFQDSKHIITQKLFPIRQYRSLTGLISMDRLKPRYLMYMTAGQKLDVSGTKDEKNVKYLIFSLCK